MTQNKLLQLLAFGLLLSASSACFEDDERDDTGKPADSGGTVDTGDSDSDDPVDSSDSSEFEGATNGTCEVRARPDQPPHPLAVM